MSWQLASFLILGAVLLGGFAWYERSRPPSQVVALVAALAALAIAGRIAFAAFPNVKPTTDIVIFAGYALGPAPGFAVGALAALVSNFWFGQGPWTPWQMAGWGLCGILGAALALGGRNAGRLSLAAACGLAGIALRRSAELLPDGDLRRGPLAGALRRAGGARDPVRRCPRRRQRRLRAARRPGDGADADPLPRALRVGQGEEEGPRRSSPPGRPAPILRGGSVAALLLVALALGALAPPRAEASEATRATAWLLEAQNRDGGFGASPDDDSGAEMTGWAMLGLEAAGRNPLDVSRGGHTPVDFLRRNLDELSSPGDLARTIIALEAAGADPRDFGGANLVTRLLAKRRDNGSYEGWPGSTAYAVIALRSAGATGGLDPSLSWLRKVQNDDGGWGDVPGSPSTADGTGAVMQALAPDSKAVRRGLSYLRQAQRPGGGFPLGGNGAVNTQSTAWAIQGILAAGGDPASFRRGGASALDYLAARQQADGHYRYSKSSDQTPVWVTAQVLVAVAGKSLPIAPPPREPKPNQSKAASGGLSSTSGSSSSSVAPATSVPPTPGVSSASPAAPRGGGAGPLPKALRPPGQPAPGASANPLLPGGQEREGSGAPVTETSAEPADAASESSTTGAVLLGLAAGALLFAATLGGRRAWMRWRYGL